LRPAYTLELHRVLPIQNHRSGNYQLDLAMVRSFPLHITETSRLDFRPSGITSPTTPCFGVASMVVGNSSFGQVTQSAIATARQHSLGAYRVLSYPLL